MWSVSRSNGFITYSSRTGFERRADMRHVVLGGAEDDLGLVGMTALTEQPQELHAAHHRHVPVEQDDVRHLGFAAGQGLLAVARLFDLELERLEDVPRDLADHLRVIDDQTAFHASTSRFRLTALIKR